MTACSQYRSGFGKRYHFLWVNYSAFFDSVLISFFSEESIANVWDSIYIRIHKARVYNGSDLKADLAASLRTPEGGGGGGGVAAGGGGRGSSATCDAVAAEPLP